MFEKGLLTTAAPLAEATIRRICQSVEKSSGVTPSSWEVKVDAALVGGFVARMGDRVYDMSVRAQLDALRHRLLN